MTAKRKPTPFKVFPVPSEPGLAYTIHAEKDALHGKVFLVGTVFERGPFVAVVQAENFISESDAEQMAEHLAKTHHVESSVENAAEPSDSPLAPGEFARAMADRFEAILALAPLGATHIRKVATDGLAQCIPQLELSYP